MESTCGSESNGIEHIFSHELDSMIYNELVKRHENKESLNDITRIHANRCSFCDDVIKNNNLKRTDFETIYARCERVYLDHSELWK